MVCNNIEVKIKSSLTSNNLALFIQKASRYDSEVFVEKDNLRANAKSLLGLLSLQISNNDKVTLIAEGLDASKAIKDLGEHLQS